MADIQNKDNTNIKKIVAGILLVGALGVGGFCGYHYYTGQVLPQRQYEQAESLRTDGQLDDAIAIYEQLGDWGDAADQLNETMLIKARNQIDGGAYETALETLARVGDYAGKGELRTQDLIAEAKQDLSDEAYAAGLVLLKTYDYEAAAERFQAAQSYVARDDAAELEEACGNAFDAVYQCSFAEGRESEDDLQMTMYLWVHSVVKAGEPIVSLGMQSDLSTGSVNSNVFGQSYMNYVYYDKPSTYGYTFSYAGSEKDAADESRQVFLMAEFSTDFHEVTTSKIYADTGEVTAAPDIRTWRVVTDAELADTVRAGIRNRLTMNLVAQGELEEDAFAVVSNTFTPYETDDAGFTLKTSDENADAEADAEDAASEETTESSEEAASDTEESGEENLDYASMTEEERKAKAEELEQAEEEERLADQDTAEENITSDYAIVVDADTGEILVDKDADARMYPASMTKIMTILVAAENVNNLTTRAEITNDILTYCTEHTLTVVGFRAGEQPTIADLMWGTALCSGGDAAKALAIAVAGSETNFVDMMNAKVEELGLTGTHFANCTGVYSDDNYTTPHDMALILYSATQNALARTVLSTRQYTTSFTEQHPAGITITNSFLRHMDQDQLPGIVLSAKTGYVTQSMCCAASYMIADDGERYICVTGHADSSKLCRADHASLYRAFAVPPSHADIEKYLEEILQGESSNVATIEAEDSETE